MTTAIKIDSWRKFVKQVRSNNDNLLCRLEQFPHAILVGGCQRSGTTMLSDVIMQSDKIVNLSGIDKELTAALILSGNASAPLGDRYCFQTTYLNECYIEYWQYSGNQKLIWVIRNPFSVAYSLTRFSENFCLDELFTSCGHAFMDENDRRKFNRFGLWSVSRIRRACYAYNAKIAQIVSIMDKLGRDKVLVIDYDELVNNKEILLPKVFDFVDLPYKHEYGDMIHAKSIKKSNKLSERNRNLINSLCLPSYQKAKELVSV